MARISKYYLGDEGERYAQKELGEWHYGHYLQSLFFQPHIRPDDAVLDYGGGNGAIASHIRCREKLVYEINPASVALCRKNGIQTISSLAPFTDYFDVVYSNHVLEHVQDPIETLIEIRKALKEGGKLLLMLPLSDWRLRREQDTNRRTRIIIFRLGRRD